MDDAKKNREPREYAQSVLRSAKSAELPVYNQVLLIYNGLDLEFQRDLSVPTSTTSINTFLTDMDAHKVM